jgi:hypothetical protein
MQLAVNALKLVDPYTPQELDSFELAEHPWGISSVDRLQEVHPVRSDYFRVLLPLLGFGRQPRVFDPPSVTLEPLGRCQRA